MVVENLEANFIIDRIKDCVEVFYGNHFIDFIDDIDSILVIPFYNSSVVMTYHPKKKVWNFPMTEMLEDEDLTTCVARIGFNEIGAIFTKIKPFAYYKVIEDSGETVTGVVIANIEKFEPKPRWSETDIVKLFNNISRNIKVKDRKIYDVLIKQAKMIQRESVK